MERQHPQSRLRRAHSTDDLGVLHHAGESSTRNLLSTISRLRTTEPLRNESRDIPPSEVQPQIPTPGSSGTNLITAETGPARQLPLGSQNLSNLLQGPGYSNHQPAPVFDPDQPFGTLGPPGPPRPRREGQPRFPGHQTRKPISIAGIPTYNQLHPYREAQPLTAGGG
jgi:hypothetical protein